MPTTASFDALSGDRNKTARSPLHTIRRPRRAQKKKKKKKNKNKKEKEKEKEKEKKKKKS